MDKNIPDIVKEYLKFLGDSRKRRPETIKAYLYDIVLFLKYMLVRFSPTQETTIDNVDISDVDIKLLSKVSIVDMIAFMNYLSTNRKNGQAAKTRKISSLNSFFNYLVNTKRYLDLNPCDGMEIPKREIAETQHVEEDDALLLVNDICGKYPLRDRAIILLFIYSSLRLHELINIHLEDLDLENQTIIIRQKNHQEKSIILHDLCRKSIHAYLHGERVNSNCNILFLSQRKKQISPRTIQHLIKTHRDKNPNIHSKISSQSLRDTLVG